MVHHMQMVDLVCYSISINTIMKAVLIYIHLGIIYTAVVKNAIRIVYMDETIMV